MTTWTPKTQQAETWTGEETIRVFDPNVFDNTPIFDTFPASGAWVAKTKQAETWAEV